MKDCVFHTWGKWGEKNYEAYVGWTQFRRCDKCGIVERRVIVKYNEK